MRMRDLRISGRRLPDLRLPVLPRWAVMAVVVVIALGVTLTLNALKEAGSFDGTAASSSERAASDAERGSVIDPVEPLDPDDADARSAGSEPLPDRTNLFGTSYGASGPRKVTVRVTANGFVNIGVYYRDREDPELMVAQGFSATRTVKGRSPRAAIVMQLRADLPGSATRATCTIFVDDIEVTRTSTSEPGLIKSCIG